MAGQRRSPGVLSTGLGWDAAGARSVESCAQCRAFASPERFTAAGRGSKNVQIADEDSNAVSGLDELANDRKIARPILSRPNGRVEPPPGAIVQRIHRQISIRVQRRFDERCPIPLSVNRGSDIVRGGPIEDPFVHKRLVLASRQPRKNAPQLLLKLGRNRNLFALATTAVLHRPRV